MTVFDIFTTKCFFFIKYFQVETLNFKILKKKINFHPLDTMKNCFNLH